MPIKQPKATKDIYIKDCPVALHNAFMAKCKLHGKTFKARIFELMRQYIRQESR